MSETGKARMTQEAKLKQSEGGLVPDGDGWFVVNAREARWWHTDELGSGTSFEGDVRFSQFGINIQVLRPGEPNCMYHGENAQEDFLVLAGECLLLVEGRERRLGAWDFVHCPPGTEHVFVGAGPGPCVILMVGSRRADDGWVTYPVSDLALAHGAGVQQQATDPREAYADLGPNRRERLPELGLPWQ